MRYKEMEREEEKSSVGAIRISKKIGETLNETHGHTVALLAQN